MATGAGPLLWLLGPSLLDRDAVIGLPSTGLYGRLHAWWAHAVDPTVVLGYPGATGPAVPDPAGWLGAPVVRALGAGFAYEALLVAGAVATVVLVGRLARRELGEGWPAAMVTAVATACPAVIAALADGDPEGVHGWALAGIALARGWPGLLVGAAAGAFAPGLVPAAAILAVREWRAGGGPWPLLSWAVAAVGVALQGVPSGAHPAAPGAWFVALAPAPQPQQVWQVYLGWTVLGLVALAWSTPSRRAWAAAATAALVGALFSSPWGPDRFLVAATLAAAIGGLGALADRWPSGRAAAAVLVGTVLLAEGWHGVAVTVPLPTSALTVPEPAATAAGGPVLDLPTGRTEVRRALWFQSAHRQPVAISADGLVGPEVSALARALVAGECPDLASHGFANLVVRREGELRELATLLTCLGKPTADDGSVARWALGP